MRISALILAALALAMGPLAGQDPDAVGLDPDARVEALIERVQKEQAAVRTLQADFVQLRSSPLLLGPEEASGVFSYRAPDAVRWEYLEPDPTAMVIRGDEMTTWYRDLDRADQVHIGRYSEKVLEYLGASGSMKTLFRYFTVTAHFPDDPSQPYQLDLSPRGSRVAKRLAGMTLWVDRELYLPVGILYLEPDGARTEYRFENLEVNGELAETLFELKLPEGTQVREIDLARGGR